MDNTLGWHVSPVLVLPQEDNFNLEQRIMAELRDLELESAKLSTSIGDQRSQKRDLLQEIVEVEKQIMLWERKITLEKEMQEALDTSEGEVVTAMKKEIQRMEQRHGELRKLQERLMAVSERRPAFFSLPAIAVCRSWIFVRACMHLFTYDKLTYRHASLLLR